MDCDLFRKTLNDFMEDNLPFDIKKAMEKHMEECEACRLLYEKEKITDEVLYDYMQAEDIEFTNIRPNIISSIEKDRYKNNIFNKLHYALRKHGKKYVASAALIAFLAVSIAQIFNGNNFFPLGIDNRKTSESAVKMNKFMDNTTGSIPNGSNNLVSEPNPYVPETGVILPGFIKQPASVDNVTPDSDHSKKSPDGSILATVIGKGENAQEEGIASILLIYKNREESIIKLTDNTRQLTPKLVEWKDNDELYVIVGYGYGTVTTGGDLFTLNINTMEVKPLYIGEKCKREVSNIKIIDQGLQLYVNVYDKDAVHYKTETEILKDSQMQ